MSPEYYLKDVFDIYQAQYNATDKLWAYFSTVTLTVLGFSVGSDKVSKSFLEASIVVIGYIVFCLGNFRALELAQKQLIQFADLIRYVAGSHGFNMSDLVPIPVDNAQNFYWAVVTAVSAGILLITFRRQCLIKAKSESGQQAPQEV